MTKNMCDGCQQGLPLVEGMHKTSSTYGWIYCTKDRYQPTTEQELRTKFDKKMNESFAVGGFLTTDLGDSFEIDFGLVKDFMIAELRLAVQEAEKRGYERGITDKRVWNAVYEIGVAEAVKKERSEIIKLAEELKYRGEPQSKDNFYDGKDYGLEDIISLIRTRDTGK